MRPDAREMAPEDWVSERRTIGFFLGARPTLFVAMNAAAEDVDFALPDAAQLAWSLVLDTAMEGGARRELPADRISVYPMVSRSLAVFAGHDQ
jgi:pullulanase/glycogen debranching enzyme